MRVKKSDVINIYNVLVSLAEVKGSVKFSYGVAKNKVLIKDEAEALINTFEEKRKSIVEKYASKDENGQPKIITKENNLQEYEILPDKAGLLNEEYKNLMVDYETILQEEVEIEFYKVNMDYLPDSITPIQVEILLDKIIE